MYESIEKMVKNVCFFETKQQNPNTINEPKVNGHILIDYPLARDYLLFPNFVCFQYSASNEYIRL